MTLPDTPLNRRLLRDWSEQDSRGGRLRTTLFSAEVEAVTPEPADPTTFSTTTMTFNLQPAGTLAEDEHPDQNVIDELIISRMISGSSSSRTETSDSIFLNTMGVLNIENEFPTTFEAKKNRCASVPALYEFVKKKHSDWMWPKGEKGDKIRTTLPSCVRISELSTLRNQSWWLRFRFILSIARITRMRYFLIFILHCAMRRPIFPIFRIFVPTAVPTILCSDSAQL